MTPLERLQSAYRWAAFGTALLVLSFLAAAFCSVMGFDFDPTEHPPGYWPEQSVRHSLALLAAIAVCGSSVCAFGTAMSRAPAQPTLMTWAAVGIVLVVVALWFACSGAVANIAQDDIWATSPPM